MILIDVAGHPGRDPERQALALLAGGLDVLPGAEVCVGLVKLDVHGALLRLGIAGSIPELDGSGFCLAVLVDQSGQIGVEKLSVLSGALFRKNSDLHKIPFLPVWPMGQPINNCVRLAPVTAGELISSPALADVRSSLR